MKDGLDSRAFAEALRAASPAGRQRLRVLFRIWLRRGAEAGATGLLCGALLMGAALALLPALWPIASPLIWAGLAAMAIGGLACFRAGGRRERAWRRANPFQYPPSENSRSEP